MTFTYGFRQLLVAGSPQLAAFSVGGAVGYPGVLLHQLRSNGSSIQINLDTGSWIGSLHGVAGIPSILMPIIMQWKGRKFAFIAACVLIITGWILAYAAAEISFIMASECFHGLGTNSILVVSMSTLGEMVSPKYRNISLLSYALVHALGMALVAISATYLHWKIVSLVMCGPMILALVLACMWPESPSWLACKGEFGKCERAFKWLRGNDDGAKTELEDLINAQKEILKSTRHMNRNISIYKEFWINIQSKDFYIPGLHIFVLFNTMYWSGILVILMYSIEMIERVTSSQNVAISGSIVMNIILFVGLAITGVLIRRFNNIPVLLYSISGTALSLLSASIVSYMQSVEVLAKDSLLCLYSLLACVIFSSLGLNSTVFTVAAELMPVKHRGIGGALYVIFPCILHTTSLKLSPYLFVYFNMWGTFLVYTINTSVCGFLIWKYVPETKDRTLQEIEHFYMYGKFVKSGIREDREARFIINSQ